MSKTILVTGATDGIGLATARTLVTQGHKVLIHGRNLAKLANVKAELATLPGASGVESFVGDMSRWTDVTALAKAVTEHTRRLDVLINNAGVFHTPETRTPDGLDTRFMVNTLAPYLLTRRLLPLMDSSSRVINLSSAAQAPVDLEALAGRTPLADMPAYAQSKLAITMWSSHMALADKGSSPIVIAVNPGSLLATKMVKEGFGVAGNDIGVGADILVRAALSDEFAQASGQYFDNDAHRFGPPHPDALDAQKCEAVVSTIDAIIEGLLGQGRPTRRTSNG
jgi:NAD(P)-dependent dehydrogenase (short-subunit alcohol dehydrogenase family)